MTAKVTLLPASLIYFVPERLRVPSPFAQQLRRRSFRIVGFARSITCANSSEPSCHAASAEAICPQMNSATGVLSSRRYRLIPHQHQIRQNSVRRFQKTAPQLLARALTRPAIGHKRKRDQPVERNRVRMRHHIRSVIAVCIGADCPSSRTLRQLGRNRLRAGIRCLRCLFPTGTAASRKKNRRHTYQYELHPIC